MTGTAQCVSRSCTSGWGDWIHGELWLTPDALVRRRLDLSETMANGTGPTVRPPLPVAGADWFAYHREAILAEHRTNRYFAFDAIATARLRHGILNDALRITLRDGTRHRLLWLTSDPAHAILFGALPGLLGPRLFR
ncbi:hypothetical protein GCM10010168_62540 [Actinoplanes ianthinogenes]|uniref:DUF2867 domain-containing protein n=1 Tax=Actinoplanes ianthinogenes TaxID=122358 RepID=A0ABM7LJS6_9ACTN|nr:hypothetical protein [Actinoplanes ianthinogenes]BCJ39498.1 hypothetical protein Aiant_01550 [Actinoplanes ianthinogenes]GGR35669.1 hypothetical protein GCM10010168_62540 [Actinoplanes ianthinogenes]